MSLVTVSAKKGGRIYQRLFDHDEARRLREADPKRWTIHGLAEHYGVSDTAVKRVLDPVFAAKLEAMAQRSTRKNHRHPCKGGCGRLVWKVGNTERSGLCRSCFNKQRTHSVRPDTLCCGRCGEWKPDEDFPRARKRTARRQRHSMCRPCNTIARREHRHKNPDRERIYSGTYYHEVRRERKRMAKFIVFQPNGHGFIEVDRVDAASPQHAIEKAAKEAGEYVAVTEARFKLMRVAPVQSLRVIEGPPAGVTAVA